MVDYTFSIPQPYDPSGDIANALKFRQAQQEQAENQLKLRAWMEDRAYTLKQRQAAAANAAVEKARKQELLDIYGNFGVTPAVTGQQGVSYSGTGVANDPYAAIQNKLITKGFLPQAQDVVEYKNKMLTGAETEAKTAKENALTSETNARTAGVLTENDKKKVELRASQIKEYGDAVLRAGSVEEVNALIDSHADVLKELGVPPEQAKANFAKMAGQVGFEQAIMQSSQGAMATQKHLADVVKSRVDQAKVNADTAKVYWEMEHPDYTVQETAQGFVAVNKKDPTDVKPIQLEGQTLMPKAAAGGTRLLEPGQRLNEKGDIEDIPGSKLFVKNSKSHANDAKNVQMVNSSTDNVLRDIDSILAPAKKSDFDANFGYGSSLLAKTPGARDVSAKLQSIKSALKEAGLQLFRSGGSIGQMTEKEWPIVEQLIASLDTNQSSEEARRTMGDIKNRLDRIRNITNDTYDNQWGQTQYHRPELTQKSNANSGTTSSGISFTIEK